MTKPHIYKKDGFWFVNYGYAVSIKNVDRTSLYNDLAVAFCCKKNIKELDKLR